jgi:flagellar protein FliO/FliZ
VASTAWSVLMLMLVLALIPLVLWGLKRLQNFRPGGGAAQLEVTAQLALGARERLVLVRVHDRVLVLGVTPQQISLLGESQATGLRPAGTPQPGNAGFAGLMRKMGAAPAGRLA